MTRSRKTAREAGTKFERLIADWLKVRLNNDNIDRRTRNGRLDRGDIGQVRAALGGRVVLELKDPATTFPGGWRRRKSRPGMMTRWLGWWCSRNGAPRTRPLNMS